MQKALSLAVATCIALASPSQAANGLGDFVKEVLTQVAVSVVADVVKDTFFTKKSSQPATVEAGADDRSRTMNIISVLVDTSVPVTERIGFYASTVDYFKSGTVDHKFILADQARYEKRWPIRSYKVRAIDEIAVAPDRSYAIARYTIDFRVSRDAEVRTGSSKVAVVIGSFNSQPRIHAIKEWIQPRHQ
jgi:hypothetical protein